MTCLLSTSTALDEDLDGEAVDQKEYRSMIGSLLYLTATRPDIVTPRPTESTGEFENLSDKAEELCYSSLFSDLCNTYLELAAVMHGQCCLNRIEP